MGRRRQASEAQVNAASAARMKGKPSKAEREDAVAEWKRLNDVALREVIECLETGLKQAIYRAAECEDDAAPYTEMQKARELLQLARNHAGSREYETDDVHYSSVLKIQCLARSCSAKSLLRRKSDDKKHSFTRQLGTDHLNESAILIQTMVRKKLARNELARRKKASHGQAAAVVASTSPGSGTEDTLVLGRSLPLHACSGELLLPEYRVHDVSGVPLTDDELRSKFAELDVAGNGYLSKERFKAFYRSLESFGLEESETALNSAVNAYNILGNDKISYDEFAIIMLKLSQR